MAKGTTPPPLTIFVLVIDEARTPELHSSPPVESFPKVFAVALLPPKMAAVSEPVIFSSIDAVLSAQYAT